MDLGPGMGTEGTLLSLMGIVVKDIAKLVVSFPWGEMSEPEFTFDLVVEPVVNVPRPPPPKILRGP